MFKRITKVACIAYKHLYIYRFPYPKLITTFKMSTQATYFVTFLTLLIVFVVKIDGDQSISPVPNSEVSENYTNSGVNEVGEDQEYPGCTNRPWICSNGESPPRSVCCGNRCVNISKDVNNCGICGFRCPTIGNWRCCNGMCRNIYLSPFNCGGCGRICPLLVCLMGKCPYTKTSSPTSFLPYV
jgi:hypothetical protein